MGDIQTEQPQTSPTIEPIRFRAGKKRKAYRQRAAAAEELQDANDGVATAISPAPVVPSSNLQDADAGRDADDTGAEAQNPTGGDSEREDNDDDDNHTTEESAVAAALRLRNARRAASRRGGVGFRSEGRSAPGEEEEDAEHALVLRDQDKEAAAAHDRIVGGITNRFMHQTGLLTILDDSHMYVSQATSLFFFVSSIHTILLFAFQSAGLIIQECIHRIPFS